MNGALFRISGGVLAGALLATLALPLVGLLLHTTLDELWLGLKHPLFLPALSLSLKTTAISLCITVLTGIPLAWWLATTSSRWRSALELVVDLPIVTPPAVVGVALLSAYGRRGVLGSVLASVGVQIPFSEKAVVIAQIVVSAPFFVQAAANAFRRVDRDLLIVARTLGASGAGAFFRIAVPLALPGLVSGASLAWARSLGEFGATLLFAGNRPGVTQTLPLAIFTGLESDVRVAIAFSLILGGVGALLLFALRALPLAGLNPSRSSTVAQPR